MDFYGNGKHLCEHYIFEEKEKKRIEQEKIQAEKERISREKREADMKRAEEEAKKQGALEVFQKVKKEPREQKKEILMYNGKVATITINTEPVGPIGKKAALEIEKIRMSREEKLQQEYLEAIAKNAKEERAKKKARKDFEKRKIEHGVGQYNKKDDDKSIVFKEGTIKQFTDTQKKHGLPEIDLFEFEGEED